METTNEELRRLQKQPLERKVDYYIEVTAVHLINMVLLKECLLCGIKPEICTPIVDSITFLETDVLGTLRATDHQQCKQT